MGKEAVNQKFCLSNRLLLLSNDYNNLDKFGTLLDCFIFRFEKSCYSIENYIDYQMLVSRLLRLNFKMYNLSLVNTNIFALLILFYDLNEDLLLDKTQIGVIRDLFNKSIKSMLEVVKLNKVVKEKFYYHVAQCANRKYLNSENLNQLNSLITTKYHH